MTFAHPIVELRQFTLLPAASLGEAVLFSPGQPWVVSPGRPGDAANL
jgi:hypothetical protein